ncbi:MAG: hypothetical protein JWL65_704 [Gammaproteobacteria bacterium]|nr:hypothetical protein [Gammaproteobacteria bacterium]
MPPLLFIPRQTFPLIPAENLSELPEPRMGTGVYRQLDEIEIMSTAHCFGVERAIRRPGRF